jgi:RNase H-fold protein (predicted Holliday junction resolvase)
MNVSRKKRNQPVDDLAAVVILQSYLDTAAGERPE